MGRGAWWALVECLLLSAAWGQERVWLEQTAGEEYNLEWRYPPSPPEQVSLWLGKRFTLLWNFRQGSLQLLRREGEAPSLLLEASVEGPSPGDLLTWQRRPNRLALLRNGRLLFRTDFPFPAENEVGWEPQGGELPRYQPVEPVFFSDDFMRQAQEMGPWRVVWGEGEVRALQSVERSANAFTFFLRPKEGRGLALTGEPFWSDYRFRVSVRPLGEVGWVGLVYHWQDEEDFCLVRWEVGEGPGKVQWIRTMDGQAEVLFEQPGGLEEGAWSRLEVWAAGERLQAGQDGRPLWDLPDSHFGQGKVGVYVEGPLSADFDDVEVVGSPRWVETFQRWEPLRWEVRRGKASCAEGLLRLEGPALLLSGSPQWEPAQVEVRWRQTVGQVGVLLGVGEGRALWLLRTPKGWEWRGGGPEAPGELLAASPLGLEEPPLHWTIWAHGGWVGLQAEGRILTEVFLPQPPRGRLGLWSEGMALVDNLSVALYGERYPPEPTITAIFVDDPYMIAWANPKGQWIPGADGGRVFRHKGLFFGDWKLDLPLNLAAPLRPLEVVLTTLRGENWATLRLEREPQRLRWRMDIGGRMADQGAWPIPEGASKVAITWERLGSFLALSLNGEQVAHHPLVEGRRKP